MHFPTTIGVCGAGTMGSGIAQVAAQSGYSVVLFDVQETMLQKSRQAIQASLQKLVEKQKITAEEKEPILQRIRFTNTAAGCVADVVIEAVVEHKAVKQQLFDELALVNSAATIFATNTSSLSVAELSEGKAYAHRFAGMHFFNPAQLMKLVEVVHSRHTAPETITALVALAKSLGKTPVVCADAPGFIVNRVARPYYLEAMHLLQQEAADIETIDAVMEATGFKLGPFKLMDLIGMDVNYAVSQIVWEALGKPARLEPSAIQQQKVEANELGKKTGKGFYDYPTG